uniref:tRNA 4-demethylwyosine synthase (AdoMet-dependent) n=1 Tax=Micromonas pusilla TaxID=38833 RepID=A0A7S0D3Q3_MICPS|mmetsp:Transcript_4233/g.17975  ORF Transcript_4233/g.17975 Transcript_4233/m.17975 type:complete len:722 (+) Transcript_4233:127-2292(+)
MGAKQSSPADASGGETDASASARAAAPPSAGATKPRAGLDAAARDLSAALPAAEPAAAPVGGRILFGSQTGTARRLAHKLANSLETRHGVRLETTDASGYDPEDLVREPVVLVLLSTYEDAEGNAVAPESARWLCRWAEESARDERFGALHLKDTRFAVFGCGNREYGAARFNAAARRLDQDLARLGGERVLRRADGDESSGRMEEQFHEWADKLGERLKKAETREKGDASGASDAPRFGAGKGRPRGSVAKKDEGSPTSVVADDTAEGRAYDTEEEEGSGDERGEDDDAALEAGSEDDMDMEDIGGGGGGGERREMVTPQLRAALTKQGYKILGSHSGVKLCRWTKAQLRGRGGCYKHSFYGIESHRCMEATPSLACANKCVFCWRHHTNPVGREWRWQMDDAETLVTSAISEHKGMIKQMKGVPGVLPERLAEGMDPRHCALSLVGEPIMYPEIDKFVSLLHAKRISTFLVTNAQFPDAITNLPPITQLYVSVDAATPETLKAIDRPLFGDYWDRFVGSLTALRDKNQRTVYRLTLVAGWNASDAAEYAKLIDLGKPDLIEIKGMTYCGATSGASNLTMKNVPYHDDVKKFGEALCTARINLVSGRDAEKDAAEDEPLTGGTPRSAEYGLACEHAHSCCILLARKDPYLVDGKWHTWIDYEKFQELVASGEPFTSDQYMLPTPHWSVWGAEEGGFDPGETRVRKVRNHPGKEKKEEAKA